MKARQNYISFKKVILLLLTFFFCNTISYGQDLSEIFDKAKNLRNEFKFEEASTFLDKNIKLFEDNNYNLYQVYSFHADLYHTLRNFSKAKVYYLKFYLLYKQNIEHIKESSISSFYVNLRNLSGTYYLLSEYKEAIAAYEELLELIERNPTYLSLYESDKIDYYFNIAFCNLLIKDISSGEKYVQKALELDTTNKKTEEINAYYLMHQGNVVEARKIFLDLAQTFGDDYYFEIIDYFNKLKRSNWISKNTRNDYEALLYIIEALKYKKNIIEFKLSNKSGITATLYKETLVINGDGEMEDFFYQKTPWFESRGKIKHIIINEGVSNIGAYVFEGLDRLESISLPGTITKIGEGAFINCIKIECIKIPGSVKSIEKYAFKSCEKIISMTIPKGITSIEDQTFFSCKKLISVDIPNSVKSIGTNAFSFCESITEIHIPENLAFIEKEAFSFCKKLTAITIPSGVTKIGEKVFDFSGLNSISVNSANSRYFSVNDRALCCTDTLLFVLGSDDFTIPEGITFIGRYAFNIINLLEYNEISSVTLPNSITSIGDFAFINCRNISYMNIPESVTNIGEGAFRGCAGLKTITLPPNLETINSKTFYLCEQLESVIIPKSVRYIGDYVFFNTVIKSIDIQNSDIQLGNSCFGGSNEIKLFIFDKKSKYLFKDGLLSVADTLLFCLRSTTGSVSIPGNIKYIEENAFQDCEFITSVSIPNGVTHINKDAFRSCRRLTSIVIPNSVIFIGEGAFASCHYLNSVVLPENLKEIKIGTFFNCFSLLSINLPKNLKTIKDYAFQYSGLVSVVLPNSLDSIQSKAFYSCEKLTSITIPENINYVSFEVFDKCPKLKTVVNLGTIPQNIDKDAFGKLLTDSVDLSKITLYVNESAVLSYQNADVWENFNVQPHWKNSETLSITSSKVDEILLQAKILHQQKENGKAVSLLLQNKELFDEAKNLSSLYGHLSWYYIFEKDFKKAEEAANIAISNDSCQIWVKINLAHSLLLQEQYSSAVNLYESLSTKFFTKKQTFSSLIINQLKEIENAGLLNSKQLTSIYRTRMDLLSLCDFENKVVKSRRLFKNLQYYNVIDILPLPNYITEKNPLSTEALMILGASNYFYGNKLYNVNNNYLQSEKCFLQLKSILDKKEKKYSKEESTPKSRSAFLVS